MEKQEFFNKEGTVLFIPERLNKFPVVLRGLTSDEVIVTFVSGLVIGLILGIIVFVMVGKAYLIPLSMIAVTAVSLGLTSSILRRAKRNKPDTWFYRKIQWTAQFNWGYQLGRALIIRSGIWTIRRTEPFRQKLLVKVNALGEETNEQI